MNARGAMFNEICIYEAKIDKQYEIETLMQEVAEFYRSTMPKIILGENIV